MNFKQLKLTGKKLPLFLNHFSIIILLGVVLTGCQSNRMTPEVMEKQLIGFHLPETPQKDKALVYFVYDQSVPSVPKEITLSYAANDKERHEREVNQFNVGLNIFTFNLFKDPPITNMKRIGTLKPGEYRTLSLEPGYYNFRYEVSIPFGIQCDPRTKFLEIQSGDVYYILLEWDAFYNRYTQQLVQNLYLRSAKDELSGRYKLSKNFKRADQ